MQTSQTTAAPQLADRVVLGSFEAALHFEDLTAHCAVKLTSMLRVTGRAHYTLWQREIGGPHFKERTGQFTPIFYMDMQVSDTPIETRDPVAVEVSIRLGKERGADGSIRRLLSESTSEVFCRSAKGERILVGRMHKQSVFALMHADAGSRRVTELHSALGLGALPERDIRSVRPRDLLTAPPGFGPWGTPVHDRTGHVWSHQQTDPNRHVHAMEYVRALETAASDVLAERGLNPATWYFARARVLFRSPCFSGEWYRRSLHLWRDRDTSAVVIAGTIHKATNAGAPPAERPAVICQLWARPMNRSDRPDVPAAEDRSSRT